MLVTQEDASSNLVGPAEFGDVVQLVEPGPHKTACLGSTPSVTTNANMPQLEQELPSKQSFVGSTPTVGTNYGRLV